MGKPWENHGKTMGKPWENPYLTLTCPLLDPRGIFHLSGVRRMAKPPPEAMGMRRVSEELRVRVSIR